MEMKYVTSFNSQQVNGMDSAKNKNDIFPWQIQKEEC